MYHSFMDLRKVFYKILILNIVSCLFHQILKICLLKALENIFMSLYFSAVLTSMNLWGVAVLKVDSHPDHNKGPDHAPCVCPKIHLSVVLVWQSAKVVPRIFVCQFEILRILVIFHRIFAFMLGRLKRLFLEVLWGLYVYAKGQNFFSFQNLNFFISGPREELEVAGFFVFSQQRFFYFLPLCGSLTTRTLITPYPT